MRVGNEYSPCALFSCAFCLVIISESISEEDTGLKKNELEKSNFGKYSVNCLGEFGILEAKLCLIEEKYLFMFVTAVYMLFLLKNI